MTLRAKTLLIVSATLVGLIVALYFISSAVLMGGFVQAEEQDARQDVQRALDALSNDLADLSSTTRDYASWDDTYTFIEDANDAYSKSNLIDTTFANLQINLMVFVHSSGRIVFSKAYDLQNEQQVAVPDDLAAHVSLGAFLLQHSDPESDRTGLLLLSEGPLLVASRPILTSEYKGPIRGTLIMARYLNAEQIERLSKVTHLSLSVLRFDDPQSPAEYRAASLSGQSPILIRPLDASRMAGYAVLSDIYGQPALVLRVDLPRTIYQQGMLSQRYLVASLVIIGLAFIVVVRLLLERLVLMRLTRLSADVSHIGADGAFSARVTTTGHDELSGLAGAINNTLSALEHASNTVRESEERYRLLFRQSPVGIFHYNPDLCITDCNDRFAAILQSNRARLVGLDMNSLQDQRVLPALRQAIEGKDGYYEGLYQATTSSAQIWATMRTAPLFDRQGRVKGGVAIVEDLTERKQAEERIELLNRDLERRAKGLAALNQAGQTLASTLDLDALLRLAMEQVRDLLGLEAASVLLCTPAPDEGSGSVENSHSELVFAAASGPVADRLVGLRLPIEAGIAGWVIREKRPVLVADAQSDPRFYHSIDAMTGMTTRSLLAVPLISEGKVLGVMEAVNKRSGALDEHDVETLEALSSSAAIAIENAQLYRAAVDAAERRTILYWLSQEIAADLDAERVYATIHQAVSRLMPAEAFVIALLDKAHQEIEIVYTVDQGRRYPAQRVPSHRGLSGHVISTGKSVRIGDLAQEVAHFDVVHFGEPPHVRSILAVPLRRRSNVLGMLSAQSYTPSAYTAEDVNMLEMLAAYAAIALENTRLYANEQQRANELALALEQQRKFDQLQREFIQNVSHELRTPLALIRGHAEMLQSGWMGDLMPEQKESIDVIVRRGQMLTTLVNDIVGTLEVERRELIHEPVDMALLTQTALAEFLVMAGQDEIVLSAEIAPDLPGLAGDTVALRRMVDNLVGNALKFTPAGGRVTVRLYQDQDTLRLQVADTGIGIPADQLGHIFDRFYQVDGGTSRRYGGVGLGLALVKSIVEAYGGQITVTSEVGAGTTFTVMLPILTLRHTSEVAN